MKLKLLIKIAIILIVLFLAGVTVWYFFIRKDPNEITGRNQFYKSMEHFLSCKDIAEQMDLTVSLYVNENIDEEAYLMQMATIRQQMNYLIADYREMKEKYHVEVGTHTYATKAGTEAIEECINATDKLIENCLTESNYSDKNKLSYVYIAFVNDMVEPMAIVNQCFNEIDNP